MSAALLLHAQPACPHAGKTAGPRLIPFLLCRKIMNLATVAPVCVWQSLCTLTHHGRAQGMRFLGFFRFSSRHNGRHILTPATLVAFAVSFGGAVRAQQLCVVPSAHSSEGRNIFSPQQELELGDIEAEWVEKNQQVNQDDRLAGHLKAIGSRVLSQFPVNHAKIRIILIDTPEADAFSAGTERIYITRTMVSILRNDDELAGVLGHEVRHILKHDNAIAVTQMFHDILGVDAVSDREDISDKFSRMLNSTGRDQNVFHNTLHRMLRGEQFHQYEADRFALYAAAAAGFSPQAYVEFFDRVGQTHGQAGNRLTDFLGVTTPEEKRLRQIYKSLSLLPGACREILPSAPSADFLAWQIDVVAYSTVAFSQKEQTAEKHRALDETEFQSPHE